MQFAEPMIAHASSMMVDFVWTNFAVRYMKNPT